MSENFILLGLPFSAQCKDSLPSQQFDHLCRQMGPLGQALRQFVIPDLKVGTLDSLMEASDDLAKLDPQMEGTIQKLVGLMEEVSQKPRMAVTLFRVNHTQNMTPVGYIKNFLWDSAQFDKKDSIRTLIEKLGQVSTSAEERVRVVLSDYSETRTKLNTATRKGQGNLAVKPISDIVAAYNSQYRCFVDTEMLTTVFVAVAQPSQKEWLETYWSLNEFVCPQSSRVVAEDKEYVLNSVVLFKKALEDFKLACRKNKYTVRDATGDEEISQDEFTKLKSKAEDDKNSFYTLLWQQYSVCYVAWIHLKAIRIFVECLLKYGLPPRFVSIVLEVDAKKEKEIRSKVEQLYGELRSPYGSDGAGLEIGALQQEFPYVSLQVTNIQK